MAARIMHSPLRREHSESDLRCHTFILDVAFMKTVRRESSSVSSTHDHASTQPWLFDLVAQAYTLWTMPMNLFHPLKATPFLLGCVLGQLRSLALGKCLVNICAIND